MTFRGVPLRRHAVEFVITALSFWFTAWILPGIAIADFGTAPGASRRGAS